ncbi:hypothetical protein [Methylorubrum podarium]|jgi:hypothetical protein|uniref:hypothetical protein n=1 Tax=Methylorubrum podarium TaxID=200476 RepID=UPI001EE1C0E4|nr:hypothetical protein [Methylorubrum podarium]GJE73064.1 hypothetical protein CHKEEEPN_4627 [Methylorubrum podarium]
MPPRARQLFAAAVVVIVAACGEKPPEYISPKGFRPFVFREEGTRITYYMLDVIAEDGPNVRFVTKLWANLRGPFGRTITYATRRADCDRLRYQTIGVGETVAAMERDRRSERWAEPASDPGEVAAMMTACRVAKKLK